MPEGKGQHSGDVGRWWVIWGLRDYESQTLLGDLGINPFRQQPDCGTAMGWVPDSPTKAFPQGATKLQALG